MLTHLADSFYAFSFTVKFFSRKFENAKKIERRKKKFKSKDKFPPSLHSCFSSVTLRFLRLVFTVFVILISYLVCDSAGLGQIAFLYSGREIQADDVLNVEMMTASGGSLRYVSMNDVRPHPDEPKSAF